MGSGSLVSILMTAMSVSLSTPMTRGGTAFFAGAVGVGGELDVDLVGFIDDVIVGDDVAARVDDEAGAEGLARSPPPPSSPSSPPWPPKKRLKKSCMSPWSAAGRRRHRGVRRAGLLRRGVRVVDCLGSDSVLMLTTAGPTCLTIWRSRWRGDGRGDDQGARVGGVDGLLLFAADIAGENRAGEDAERERSEERESGGEAVAAKAIEESLRHLVLGIHR